MKKSETSSESKIPSAEQPSELEWAKAVARRRQLRAEDIAQAVVERPVLRGGRAALLEGKLTPSAELRSIVDRCHHALGESEYSDDESLPEAIATHIGERNQRIAELERNLAHARAEWKKYMDLSCEQAGDLERLRSAPSATGAGEYPPSAAVSLLREYRALDKAFEKSMQEHSDHGPLLEWETRLLGQIDAFLAATERTVKE